VPGDGDGEPVAGRLGLESAVGEGAVAVFVGFRVEHDGVVQVGEHRGGVVVDERGGAQGIADQRGQGGGRKSFAAHVAEEDRPGSGVVGGEQVVEVPTDVIIRQRLVERGGLKTRYAGEPGRDEVVAEGGGDVLRVVPFGLDALPGRPFGGGLSQRCQA